MSIEVKVFNGTPDDWWEQAAPIMESEATAGRALGSWYITKIKTAGDTKPGYRLSTPSRPPNMDQLMKAMGPHDKVSTRVRKLIEDNEPLPAWMTSEIVIADTKVGKILQRLPWVRKPSGRWRSVFDGSRNINDHQMAELNPAPAKITEVTE